MTRYLLAAAVALTAAATASSATLAAPPRQEGTPGRALPARVTVINKDRAEAIPVVLQDQKDLPPVRTSIVGTPRVVAESARQVWEYRQVVVASGQDAAGSLTPLGNEGWEAVGLMPTSSGATILLKRPK